MENFSKMIIKLSGMIIIIYSILNIPKYLSWFISYNDKSLSVFVFSFILPVSIPIVVGAILFIKYERITNMVVCEEIKVDNLFFYNIEKILLTILGIYLFLSGISDLSLHISSFLQGSTLYNNMYNKQLVSSFITSPYIITTVIEIALSVILLTKTEKIMNIIEKIRN